MIRVLIGVFVLGALAGCAHEQVSPTHLGPGIHEKTAARPKLVVQIVVDQLRGDIPLMYETRFGEGGYRVLFDGAWYTNARHPHSMTETVVGHTTLATGAYPARHGMISDAWYDRAAKKVQNNVNDERTTLVGTQVSGSSPRRVLTTTSSDELELATAGRAKVFAVAGKDRAAVPLAGHAGKAFWFTATTGEFVSSTYYYSTYPDWVKTWNADKAAHVDRFLGQTWTLGEPKDRYVYQANANVYPKGSPPESMMAFLAGPDVSFGRTFPHTYGTKPGQGYYNNLTIAPAADDLVVDFAIKLIEQEGLGADEVTDYLGVGLSSTDLIGHWFGTMSLESEDNQLRLDRSLARLFSYLDQKVGLENTLIVLAGDHGMAMFPEALAPYGIVSGRTSIAAIAATANDALKAKYPRCADCIMNFNFPNFYLDYPKIAAAGLSREEVAAVIVSSVSAMTSILLAIPAHDLHVVGPFGDPELMTSVRRNWHPVNSGDVYVVQRPDWQVDSAPASGEAPNPTDVLLQHGSPWAYDTHVPIAFAGAGVQKQRISRGVLTVDVAATLSLLLRTRNPSGLVGDPLSEVLPR